MFYQKNCCYYGTYHLIDQKTKTFLWTKEC
jgi:hypothetical protein